MKIYANELSELPGRAPLKRHVVGVGFVRKTNGQRNVRHIPNKIK